MTFVAVPIKGSNDAVIGVLAAADRETREGGIARVRGERAAPARRCSPTRSRSRSRTRACTARRSRSRPWSATSSWPRRSSATFFRRAIPQIEGIEIAALSRPARQVGGDYHAFFVRDGVITTLVADVAGKSMPAALLVSALHAVVQLLFAEGREHRRDRHGAQSPHPQLVGREQVHHHDHGGDRSGERDHLST